MLLMVGALWVEICMRGFGRDCEGYENCGVRGVSLGLRGIHVCRVLW